MSFATRLFLAALFSFSGSSLLAQNWSTADDGSVMGPSNASGTTDKVCTVKINSNSPDKKVKVLVIRSNPDGDNTVVDEIEITDTNNPQFTVGAGCYTVIYDGDTPVAGSNMKLTDTDTNRPSGTATLQ